jgi:hypothetical protein
VSIDFVNRFHDFSPAAAPPERARDAALRLERAARPPVFLVAINFSSLGLRATRS